MPEFRQDPVSGRWVIIAEDRAGRPSEFASQPARHASARCPFCAGNEADTPDAITNYGSASSSSDPSKASWEVRVIPNKYPAAVIDTNDDFAVTGSPGFEFVRAPGIGIHEVIIESPSHVASFTELSPQQAALSVLAYRDRLIAASRNHQVAYGLVFKNCRGGGGATLEHAHSQLLATSMMPHEVELEVQASRAHWERQSECLFCRLLNKEKEAAIRIVAESRYLAAYCPFASRFPYETWIVPRHHQARFELSHDDLRDELTLMLVNHLKSLEKLFPGTAYNFWIHTAPFHMDADDFFHWHLEIIPRVTTQAGYEWGAGCFVNPVSPETAARNLRQFKA